MKSIFKLLILVLVAYIGYCAYQDTKTNGKSIWYNVGFQFKKVFVIGTEKVKIMVSDLQSGLNNS